MSLLTTQDNVCVTCATVGQGSFTLGPAIQGFQSFALAYPAGGQRYYFAREINLLGQNGIAWEIGIGTLTNGVLSRDTIIESSNSGSKAVFPGPMTYVSSILPIPTLVSQIAADEANYTPLSYFTPINNTGAVSDLVLMVGQSAFINVSAATSIPLYVACGDGQSYEIDISLETPTTSTADAYLNPNNTTYAGAIECGFIDFSSAISGIVGPYNYFRFFPGGIYFIKFKVSTNTLSKNMAYSGMGLNGGAVFTFNGNAFWNNNSTVWSSLGTIILPTANTGRIDVRRTA